MPLTFRSALCATLAVTDKPPPRPDDPSVLESDNTPDDAVNRIDYQIDTSPDNRLNTHPLTIRITPNHDDPYH